MTVRDVHSRLEAMSDPAAVAGMARYGITARKVYGVSAPKLRALAKEIGKDQRLSLALWRSGSLEARAIASFIGDPALVTGQQMDRWVRDFDSWALCDTVCGNLFDRTPFAVRKALEWSKREREFEKRAGFVLMAELAVHDKHAPDATFLRFLPAIIRGSTDERNLVKKAVNWALRQIGKRNAVLHRHAVSVAVRLRKSRSGPARWIAADALRELRSTAVRLRLKGRAGRSPLKRRVSP